MPSDVPQRQLTLVQAYPGAGRPPGRPAVPGPHRAGNQEGDRFVDDPADRHGLRSDVMNERVQALDIMGLQAGIGGTLVKGVQQRVGLPIHT